MKTLKINGEIIIPDEMNLNDFCKLFNKLQDENNFGFSGFIKDNETSVETETNESKEKDYNYLFRFTCYRNNAYCNIRVVVEWYF